MIFIGHKKEEKKRILFLKKIVRNVKTLDLGAAEGSLTKKLVNAKNVTAMDIYKDEIKNNVAKKKIIGDIRSLSFKNDEFEQIILFEVIEHQEKNKDREAVLKEAYRVLKKGREFILSTPNKKRLTYYFRKFLGKEIIFPYLMGEDLKRTFGNYHYIEYTSKELKKKLTKIGFSKILIYNYYFQIPYIQLFFKIKSRFGPTLFIKCQK